MAFIDLTVERSRGTAPLGPARAPFIPRRDRRELRPENVNKILRWNQFCHESPFSKGARTTPPPPRKPFSHLPCPPSVPRLHHTSLASAGFSRWVYLKAQSQYPYLERHYHSHRKPRERAPPKAPDVSFGHALRSVQSNALCECPSHIVSSGNSLLHSPPWDYLLPHGALLPLPHF